VLLSFLSVNNGGKKIIKCRLKDKLNFKASKAIVDMMIKKKHN
jgi:hypothetical protein